MEKFLQIAPHSLAIVLGPADNPAEEKPGTVQPPPPAPTQPRQLARHHIGYEIFADFKAENMQHFWNKKVTAAVAETFFLGWIDEQVLLIQGKEEHLEALREGWTRRALRPPSGFQIRCLGECRCLLGLPVPALSSALEVLSRSFSRVPGILGFPQESRSGRGLRCSGNAGSGDIWALGIGTAPLPPASETARAASWRRRWRAPWGGAWAGQVGGAAAQWCARVAATGVSFSAPLGLGNVGQAEGRFGESAFWSRWV